MSKENPKNPTAKSPILETKPASPKSLPPAKPVPGASAAPVDPPPLFRKIDWLTFGITTLLTFLGYWWTLAPDLTLEDSGELAVASMYAGVPHPPGYPVWTIYTWLFTVLVPFSNIAYRVALASAVAGAFSCGLVGLMVSRGSSMMIEGIADLKNLDRRLENALCVVAGFVSALLIGFNGFMWSQAVIVEVYTLSVLSLAGVLVSLLRWIYAPHQYRYLYLAFFWFGISFNNHQSLLVTAMGLEVAVLAAHPKLGRDLFFWNVIVYLGGLVLKSMNLITTLDSADPSKVSIVFVIYNLIGIASFIAWVYLLFKTKKSGLELARDVALVATLGYLLAIFGHITTYATAFYDKETFSLRTGLFILFNLVGLGCIAALVYLLKATAQTGREWLSALICGLAWTVGAAFYVYMPLASMSNPPLNWGYPRTVAGFFHAFTRGQYERIRPTEDLGTYFEQVGLYVGGALEEFNFVYILIGLVPFLFWKRMQSREKAWLSGLSATYLCLSFLLLWLLNPAPDRQSRDLNRVFFTASHVMIAMGTGYGLTLIGATLVLYYERVRKLAIYICAALAAIALFIAAVIFQTKSDYHIYSVFFDLVPSLDPLTRLVAVMSVVLPLGVVALFVFSRQRAPMQALLLVFAVLPLRSILAHWSDNEQRGHRFGYWFGHDMFTPPFNGPDGKPIYPEMTRDAVLFGGTDPGRFNPTYMIFCESFIPPACKKETDPNFDRRDVLLITQNALADGTYLNYIRAHYNRSTQPDPFFFSELLRGPKEREMNLKTNLVARLMLPLDRFFTGVGDRIEDKRRAGTSYFTPEDFTDLPGLVAKLRKGPQQDPLSAYLFERLTPPTQQLLAAGGPEKSLRRALARDLNARLKNELKERRRLEADLQGISSQPKDPAEKDRLLNARIEQYRREQHQLYEPERFAHVNVSPRTTRFLKQNPANHSLIRVDRLLLEEAYPKEIAKSLGGVYPDMEINTPSNDDSQRAFTEYLNDAQRRLQLKQLRPGEDVRIIENKVQVSGQVAVMAINGLLTKVIFDKNPESEFFVEESFPLDWMYPYLSPYGIIMKINRNRLTELTQEMVDKDHQFWTQFSTRLIGNWITYDTTVSNICEFADRVYRLRDYKALKKLGGVPEFMRDNDGQKAFSKLRSSIAGVYAWRIDNPSSPVEQQRMLKEAEFAFKQAYAFCPYSPEAIFRYVNLLIRIDRVDDALLLANTSIKLDPFNKQLEGLTIELKRLKLNRTSFMAPPPPSGQGPTQLQGEIAALEQALQADPANFASGLKLVMSYVQAQQHPKAIETLDKLMAHPQVDDRTVLSAANIYNQLGQIAKVEMALAKLVQLVPENPEAWFDLAGLQALLSKRSEAVNSLRQALQLSNKRLSRDPKAANLYSNALTDQRFASLREAPEFKNLLAQPKAAPN